MSRAFWCKILLIFLSGGQWVMGQQVADCELSYARLRASIEVDETQIRPGKQVQLSDLYLQRLSEGTYAQVQGELRYYEYVRPATKKEIRKGKVKGSAKEKMGRNGNIYVDVPLASDIHFFETTPAFNGDYTATWKRQEMILPVGVVPTDVGPLATQPIKVLAREPDYVLLESAGRQVVFYRGFPPLGEVFDTPEVQAQLVEKRREAERWLGRNVLIRQPHELVVPPYGQAGAWVWAENQEQPQEIQSVIAVDRDVVVLGMVDQRHTLRLSDTSQLRLFDADCVASRQEDYLDSLRRVFSRQEVQLEMFTQVSVNQWAENLDLKRHLAGRFGPQNWPDSNTTYRYLLQPERSSQPHIYPRVDQKGRCWLVSYYLSEKGLYHTRLRVFVGNDSMDTQRVSPVDRRNQRSYRGQQIIEEVVFDHPKDEAIIAAIAQAGDQPVRIRFIAGGDFYREVRLPALYRSAIRDAWMWAQTLRNTP
jgi:hypothetical protein